MESLLNALRARSNGGFTNHSVTVNGNFITPGLRLITSGTIAFDHKHSAEQVLNSPSRWEVTYQLWVFEREVWGVDFLREKLVVAKEILTAPSYNS